MALRRRQQLSAIAHLMCVTLDLNHLKCTGKHDVVPRKHDDAMSGKACFINREIACQRVGQWFKSMSEYVPTRMRNCTNA